MTIIQHYEIALVATGITLLFDGIFVYFKNPKKNLYQIFAFYHLCAAIWSIGEAFLIIAPNKTMAIFWSRFLHAGVIFIPIAFSHFIFILLDIKGRKRIFLKAAYIFGFIFLILNFTELLMPPPIPKFNFRYYWVAGILYPYYISGWFIIVAYALFELFKAQMKSEGTKRNQLQYLFWSTLFGYIGGVSNYLPAFNIHLYPYNPFGTYTVPIYSIVIAYAIIKYRLMDINIALTRAGILAVVYVFVLGIPFWIGFRFIGKGLWILPVSIMAIFATLGPFLYNTLRRRAEDRLLAEDRIRHKTLQRLSTEMLRFTRLDTLLKAIVHNLVKIMQIKSVSIYLFDSEKNQFNLRAAWQPPLKTPALPLFLNDNSIIHRWLSLSRCLVFEEIRFSISQHPTKEEERLLEEMKALNAQLIIPAYRQDNILGLLILGEKRLQRAYTQDDQTVLSILANSASLAIENALFYEHETERQAVLFHSATLASLGTMASMMGHQVNNRFQALTFISSRKDILKMTLERNPNLSREELLKLVQEDIEKFQKVENEAEKGGKIVFSIRRLSKLSKEGFKPISIDEAVKIALDAVQYKVKLEEFDLIIDIPKDLPSILGDSTQLGESFFNFVDNGYDAIKDRRERLKEENYRGRLTIRAFKKDDSSIQIEVSDDGIGVKQENLPKLFVPFFTTKASSEKGTGLGLYVVREIIKFHSGTIKADSKYGQGTRFTITLPIAKI